MRGSRSKRERKKAEEQNDVKEEQGLDKELVTFISSEFFQVHRRILEVDIALATLLQDGKRFSHVGSRHSARASLTILCHPSRCSRHVKSIVERTMPNHRESRCCTRVTVRQRTSQTPVSTSDSSPRLGHRGPAHSQRDSRWRFLAVLQNVQTWDLLSKRGILGILKDTALRSLWKTRSKKVQWKGAGVAENERPLKDKRKMAAVYY